MCHIYLLCFFCITDVSDHLLGIRVNSYCEIQADTRRKPCGTQMLKFHHMHILQRDA
jgi:hypothetical protein